MGEPGTPAVPRRGVGRQHSTALNDPFAMNGVAYAGEWADLEFLHAPQDVGEGFVLKHDLPRIDALLATEWELNRQRVRRRR